MMLIMTPLLSLQFDLEAKKPDLKDKNMAFALLKNVHHKLKHFLLLLLLARYDNTNLLRKGCITADLLFDWIWPNK